MAANKIYGVLSVFNFGIWSHTVFIFDSLESAEEWLHTETACFAEREIFRTKKEAIALAGARAVNDARDYSYERQHAFLFGWD